MYSWGVHYGTEGRGRTGTDLHPEDVEDQNGMKPIGKAVSVYYPGNTRFVDTILFTDNVARMIDTYTLVDPNACVLRRYQVGRL